MKLNILLITLISIKATYISNVKIFNKENDNNSYNIPFILNPTIIDYGKKVGVHLNKFNFDENCEISKIDKIQWFAALIEVDNKCNKDIMRAISNLNEQGADFIFIQNIDSIYMKKILERNIIKWNIKVPVFIIESVNKDFYSNIIKNEEKKNSVEFLVKLSITFPEKEEDDDENFNKNLNINIFYLTSDYYSYNFLKEFGKIYEILVEKINLNLIPAIFELNGEDSKLDKYCVSKGKYCYISNKNNISGREMVIEGLREKLIFKYFPKKFFSYIEKYNSTCLNSEDVNCFLTVLKRLEINLDSIEEHINFSFINNGEKDLYNNENNILKDDHDRITELNDSNFPALYINNKLYEGSHDFNDLLIFTCSMMKNKIDACKIKISDDDEYSNFGIILFAFILFLILFIFLFIFCKNYTENKYKENFNKIVDKYMTEYSSMKTNEV